MGKDIHLNAATNRFGLNKKRSVGDLNTLIAIASPHEQSDWEEYYFEHGRSRQEIDGLGTALYRRLQDTILPEIRSITEDDCKSYIKDLVIGKTFQGRRARYDILRGELLRDTGKDFKFLPDDSAQWPPNAQDWRQRTFCIDYFHYDEDIDLLIGVKVCPESMAQSTDPTVVRARQHIQETHREWQDKGWGRLFILYYTGDKNQWTIANKQVVAEIADL